MLGIRFIGVNGYRPIGHRTGKVVIGRAAGLSQQASRAADQPADTEAKGGVGNRQTLGGSDRGNGKVHDVFSLFGSPGQNALTRSA